MLNYTVNFKFNVGEVGYYVDKPNLIIRKIAIRTRRFQILDEIDDNPASPKHRIVYLYNDIQDHENSISPDSMLFDNCSKFFTSEEEAKNYLNEILDSKKDKIIEDISYTTTMKQIKSKVLRK